MNEIIICGYTGRGFDSPHLKLLLVKNNIMSKIQRIFEQYLLMLMLGLGFGIIFTFIVCGIAFVITYFSIN